MNTVWVMESIADVVRRAKTTMRKLDSAACPLHAKKHRNVSMRRLELLTRSPTNQCSTQSSSYRWILPQSGPHPQFKS